MVGSNTTVYIVYMLYMQHAAVGYWGYRSKKPTPQHRIYRLVVLYSIVPLLSCLLLLSAAVLYKMAERSGMNTNCARGTQSRTSSLSSLFDVRLWRIELLAAAAGLDHYLCRSVGCKNPWKGNPLSRQSVSGRLIATDDSECLHRRAPAFIYFAKCPRSPYYIIESTTLVYITPSDIYVHQQYNILFLIYIIATCCWWNIKRIIINNNCFVLGGLSVLNATFAVKKNRSVTMGYREYIYIEFLFLRDFYIYIQYTHGLNIHSTQFFYFPLNKKI